MDIKIVSSAGWYQMFINDMLAASFFHQGITVPDYVGFFCYGTGIGNVIANWDDFSISDLGVLRDSYVFPPDKDARSAIQELIGNERIDIRMRYDGALVATRDRLRASVDTYSTTVEKIRKIFSNVDGFSQAQQADQVVRWVGKLLERGRHVKFFTFPDAQNDVQSYEQMREPIRAGQEKATQWNVDCAPVFTAECGDRVTLANQDSGETVDVVIKSMNWRRDFQTKLAQGSVLFHKFIS